MSDTIQKGAYKTKTKFIEFIGGKGHINFLSNEATISGNQLSGLEMDGINFKLTICDDMTVHLDEIDTNHTTKSQRARLVEIIEEKTIAQYRGRTVVQELDFKSTSKVKDKYIPLYLAVEVEKPIQKLTSLFDDDIEISDDAMDNLNDLLNSWFEDEDFAKEVQEMINEENSQVSEDTFMKHHDNSNNIVQSQIEDSFTKMKEQKLIDLKSSLDKKQIELNKQEFQVSTLEKNIKELESDIKLLEDRIDDIQPIEPFVGYYFNVSERQNETIVLEPEIEKIIKDKVSKVKSINVENFMKLFTDGEFHIKLGQKSDNGFELVTDYTKLDKDLLLKLSKLNLNIDDDKLVYQGDMIWSQIVNKMIKLGFEENPDFNKLCGSNSYESKTETKEEIVNNKTTL